MPSSADRAPKSKPPGAAGVPVGAAAAAAGAEVGNTAPTKKPKGTAAWAWVSRKAQERVAVISPDNIPPLHKELLVRRCSAVAIMVKTDLGQRA